MNLALAYDACERVTKTYSSSFYQAFRLLPKPERHAIWAVYAFCRQIDNLVDEEGLTLAAKRQNVEQFEQLMHNAMRGDWLLDDPMWVALRDVFSRYEMEWQPFQEMIDGQRADLDFRQPETMAELERYCYLVAGTVGLMILPILAPNADAVMRRDAVCLGQAMQVTNILRDIAEDYDRGRIYLPRADLARYGVTPEILRRGQVTPEWVAYAAALAAQAEELYEIGLHSFTRYPLRSRLPLLAAGEVYRAILRRIVAKNFDVFTERVYVSDEQKALLVGNLRHQLEPEAVSSL